MRIETLINTDIAAIEAHEWNPYLGISINNKAFTQDYIYKFMDWAASRSKDGAAVLVVDIIQRINNEILGKAKPLAAIEKAFSRADEILALCKSAHESLTAHKKERIVILEWPDIMYDKAFENNARVFNDAFENEPEFRGALIATTRENLGAITGRLDESQIEKLTRYVLSELPEIFAGFNHKGVHYNLNVYPGKILEIYTRLNSLECFKAIRGRLLVNGKIAIAEAY